MLLDLSKVIMQDGKVLETEVELEMEEMRLHVGRFPITKKTPLQLTVTNTGEQVIEILGTCGVTVAIPCGRCLVPVEYPMELEIRHKVDTKKSVEEREEASEETDFLVEKQLDPEILVRNELLINWPIRVLCKEDCKGICSCCGTNLNERECGCDRTQPDPRMAAISDIFSKLKEV